MKKQEIKKNGLGHITRNQVLIGDWQEVQNIDAKTIHPNLESENLDGLIIKGYEMKFDKVNENGEKYDPTAFDEFIEDYFIKNKLNMPVDINHEGDMNWHAYCGRVLYFEVNSVGAYFAVYIPRTYPEYDRLKWAYTNGIIQGFSKYGFVRWDDSEFKWKDDGSFDYELIHKIRVTAISLVCTPANGLPFEQAKETQNALIFENKINKEEDSVEEEF